MELANGQHSGTITGVCRAVAESGRSDLIVKAVPDDQTIVVFNHSTTALEIPFFQWFKLLELNVIARGGYCVLSIYLCNTVIVH